MIAFNQRHTWLPAAVVTTVVAVAEVVTILHLIPGTTIIDTGALFITGFLAGLFTGLHITR